MWWVLAALVAFLGLFLLFRCATATYNGVEALGSSSVHQVACQSVYGWVRGQGVQLTATEVSYLNADQRAGYYACRAAIGDRETTIEVLLGFAVAFAVVGYGAQLRESRRALAT